MGGKDIPILQMRSLLTEVRTHSYPPLLTRLHSVSLQTWLSANTEGAPQTPRPMPT